MQFTQVIASAILLFSTTILAAPLPQLAGEGEALNSIFSSTDNGIGFGVENAEDNTADLITSIKGGSTGSTTPAGSGGAPPPPPHKVRRQFAGEGQALNSIFSSTDNGVGFAVKDAEDNTAGLISKVTASVPKIPKTRRQLDKIANGAKNIGNAAGVSAVVNPVGDLGDSLDGALTGGVANAGAQIGKTEETTLESAGSAIPK
jgi:hypothetical protein